MRIYREGLAPTGCTEVRVLKEQHAACEPTSQPLVTGSSFKSFQQFSHVPPQSPLASYLLSKAASFQTIVLGICTFLVKSPINI